MYVYLYGYDSSFCAVVWRYSIRADGLENLSKLTKAPSNSHGRSNRIYCTQALLYKQKLKSVHWKKYRTTSPHSPTQRRRGAPHVPYEVASQEGAAGLS